MSTKRVSVIFYKNSKLFVPTKNPGNIEAFDLNIGVDENTDNLLEPVHFIMPSLQVK